jgi:hypothetical protein
MMHSSTEDSRSLSSNCNSPNLSCKDVSSRKIRPRAKARKTYIKKFRSFARLLGNVDPLKDESIHPEFIILNKKVLEDISNILYMNPSADLREILPQYVHFVENITNSARIQKENESSIAHSLVSNCDNKVYDDYSACFTSCDEFNSRELGDISNVSEDDSSYNRDIKQSNRLYIKNYATYDYDTFDQKRPLLGNRDKISKSYQAMLSIIDKDYAKESKSTLESLLEQEIIFEDKSDKQFNYIKIEDVLKTKGNSVMGPKREDVGKYNRKLFEMQEKEMMGVSKITMHSNPKFFREASSVAATSEIIYCEEVLISYFNLGKHYNIGNFFLLVHKNQGVIHCTVKDKKTELFKDLSQTDIEASYLKGTKKIHFLCLETFIIYRVVFSTVDAASSAYESFFKK